MSRRKLAAALAALTTAAVIAVPAGSASAQITLPAVNGAPVCALTGNQVQAEQAQGNALLANLLSGSSLWLGCGGTLPLPTPFAH